MVSILYLFTISGARNEGVPQKCLILSSRFRIFKLNPKSTILMFMYLSMSILESFRSLCHISLVCMYATLARICLNIILQSFSSRFLYFSVLHALKNFINLISSFLRGVGPHLFFNVLI